MKFSIRTAEHYRDFQFIMHAEGCKDIRKDANVYGGYTETVEGPDAKTAANDWLTKSGLNGPDYETPWTVEHIRFLPCCK